MIEWSFTSERLGQLVRTVTFDEVYLANGTFFPTTYLKEVTGTTKGTAIVTYTDGKPTKMVWECAK